MKENKFKTINNKAATELLTDYLEGVIVDPMILNSFIRGIKVKEFSKTSITITTPTLQTANAINNLYLNYIKEAVINVFETELDITVTSETLAETKIKRKIGIKSSLSEKYLFNNYIVADFNKETVDMAHKIISYPGKFSPLFITSRSGLGKTHLLHAIGHEFANSGLSVKYMEPNDFTRNISSLSKMGKDSISKYINNIKKFDVLLFDDIQNVADRIVSLRVLFEIINSFIDSQKQIIIASDKLPNEISGFEERFITRFSSGLTTKINRPSIDDLVKILEFKLDKENLSPEKWEKEALNFVARNNSNSIRSIEGAIKRVSFFAIDSSHAKYTYSIISQIFKKLAIDPIELTPTRVVTVVASYYKIKNSSILGKSRKAEFVIARHMAMWLIRHILNTPLGEIGKMFGGRDHSTVISAIKSINTKMTMNETVKHAANVIENKIKLNS